MEQDKIIHEVRAVREAYAERFGFDVHAIFLDAKKREGREGRKVVCLEPRLVQNESEAQECESTLAEVRREA